MQWRIFILLNLIFIISINSISAQPANWDAPISGKVLLSGTFGELRGSHYHAGTDIKPNMAGPQNVLAVADGYVKEVRVHGGSYGNALLIQHKDGNQSLYGHLDHFVPALDSMVHAHQYDQEQFEVTLTFDSTKFPVSQGMIVATMGNTGYSFGRHLHFEVRHTSGTMYNPLLVIPALQDDTPPQFRNLKINYHDDHGREYDEKIVQVRALGNGRYTAGDLVLNTFKYSLGVDVVDRHRNTHNRNGIYNLELYRDTLLIYHSVFDSLSRDDRKYYPEHIDHITSPGTQAIYHNLRYESERIDQQLNNPDKGLIRPYPFQTQNYTIKSTDYQGNASSLTFSIRQVNQPSIDYAVMYNYIIRSGRSNRINLDQYSVFFPPGTFVRDQRLYVFEEEVVRDNEKIHMIHMNENQLPLYENSVLILKSDLPADEKSKWTLARCTGNNYRAILTNRENDHFAAWIDQMASYCLVKDTLPPDIDFIPQNNNLWYFKLSDNLHSSNSLAYSATVDGQWTLVGADHKNSRLFFKDFSRYRDGNPHEFRLEVSDNCGNRKELVKTFK